MIDKKIKQTHKNTRIVYHLDASEFEKKLILEREGSLDFENRDTQKFKNIFIDTPSDFDGDLAVFLENILKNGSDEDKSIKNAEILTIFITHKITPAVLKLLSNLKLICTRSTGTDHIDLKVCEARKIVVKNVVGYGSGSVAEHTFALTLNLSHHIDVLNGRTENLDLRYLDCLGFDLEGKTLGVIGACGSIGRKVVQIASGFGMKILANDYAPDLKMEQDFNLKFCTVDEILKQSDIITLHVPLLDSTKDLLNKENLKDCGSGKLLINTARGGIISNETLLWAVDKGIFEGVGVDALEYENFFKDLKKLDNCLSEKEVKESCQNISEFEEKNVLVKIIKHPRILFTPHSAYYTDGSLRKIINGTFINIKEFLK